MFSRNRPDRDDRKPQSQWAYVYEWRSNRGEFWLVLTGLLAGIWLSQFIRHIAPAGAFGAVVAVVVNVSIRRIHDMGLSGWWAAVLPGGMVLSLFAVAKWPGHPIVLTASWVLGVAAFTVVVGLWPGQPEVNRFGDPPQGRLKAMFAPRSTRRTVRP